MPFPIVDAHFYHNSNKLMHFPTVDDIFSLNSNTLMLIPTSWCKFQHVDANSNTLMLIPTSWCTFQLLMHIFSPLTNFVSFSHKRKGPNWFWPPPNKDCQSWTCWCTFQQFNAIFILLLCYIPTSWCTFQLLIPFLLRNITAVDAPVPTVDASFILLLKLLFSQTQPWDAQNH